MNDNEKDREEEIPELRLENEDLNKAVPEIEIDASDITIVDDTADGGAGEIPASGPALKDDGPGRKAPPENEEAEPALDVLDYRSFERTKDIETPALDRKLRQSAQGASAATAPQGSFPTRTFNPGDVIFSEGDPGNEAYLILSGQVKVTRQYKKKIMKINQLGAGQIFGEMAIITGEPRTATVEALEPTEVFIITESKLKENLSHNLAIVKSLIDQLIDRLKQLLKQQSAMIGKVERALLIDKKLEVIKAQVKAYEKKKSYEGIDTKLKVMFESILKL